MKLFEVQGTYGSGKTKATILVAEERNGDSWYCVEGSVNVNKTSEPITHGVDVEELSDFDMFTAGSPIETLEELEAAIED